MKNFAFRALRKTEKVARRWRLKLEADVARDGARQKERPNTVAEWEKVYLTPVQSVSALTNEIARTIVDLTAPGDVLLETGCGSGVLSAEVATTGRKIELADFSPQILNRAAQLFAMSKLTEPRRTVCDITKALPWPDRAVDVTWSSGVLEHWTDDEIRPIVREMARVSRKRVVSFVPYAGCVFYRWGKHVAEAKGEWPYGREMPRASLRAIFEEAGLVRIQERTLSADEGLYYLHFVDETTQEQARAWWHSIATEDPIRQRQGYLLLTVGDVP